jgi:Ca2+-binding RTX toxin-like protein
VGAILGVAAIAGWVVVSGTGPSAAAGTERAVRCHGLVATVVGTDEPETLKGTPGRDVIAALGGNDTVNGLGGNDVLCGGLGADRLSGGPGDDVLRGGWDRWYVNEEGSVERDGDQLAGGPGDDRLDPVRDPRKADEVIPDVLSWEDADGGVRIDVAEGVATGEGHDRFVVRRAAVVGSAYGDVIDGSSAADQLFGGPGPDRIRGLGGHDRIVTDPGLGGHARDVALGGLGEDAISAGGGEDVLRGGPGDDLVDDMGPAADRLYGGPGRDMLFTQITDVPGADQVVDGGPGRRDLVDLHTQTINPATQDSSAVWSLSTGLLTFTLDHPVSLTVAHVERVNLSAWGTTWTITGTPGADWLSASGSWGTDFLGRGGDDVFLGSDHDDLFNGGAGTDRSRGMGSGTDTCLSVELFDATGCETTSP